ncbi:DUF397 domain-containing protein [Streptomyces sp. P38-E01]|uniref:DUF397 domain-containing protein n=1 Tax=Streptomyces tardus TaxID=2780544 RepID=A0A949JID8_9ACTN|nr:DUF397 domain-containing protein [Streptomyces tardus]MBU7596829.1 DUF397 domain-containing protein [Streptomyces tardus]
MSQFRFRKSGYSSGSGECVEVADNVPGAVAVRDSKTPRRAHVLHSPAAWAAFLTHLRKAHTL